ncbi:MAG TPA: glycoside hydrolase family 30 beta sandwich domain-containing protein [Chitinophagaceae bacterium]|nr:glycoside hydrolase family 30 beta sandwich domain-containing protein [Chitinophagaceae bacterium]
MLRRLNHTTSYFLKLAMLVLIIIPITPYCSKKNNSGGGGNETFTFDAEITIMGNDSKQVIQGFGCATVFNPPNTTPLVSEEFDRLFGQGANQVGLNILRIRVATDDAWRTTELNYAKAAVQRGAKILATPWSPPARMKTNNNLIGGSLITDSSGAYASYLNDFANYMSANGAPLYAVSVQNEPDIRVNYESCDWAAEQMKDFLKNYGLLITGTRVMAPESFNNNQAYVNTILNDDAAAANLDIVGGHIYGSGITENPVAKIKGKEVWMTEHLDTNISYAANLNTAIEIHECLTKANFSAYLWWYGKRFYGPIGQDGTVTKRGYIMSQFARFITPGSFRLGTGNNSRHEILISAFKNTSGKKTIVAINNSDGIARQKITFSDAVTGVFIPYTTSPDKNAAQGAGITVSNNNFTYSLPPRSVTTFVEQ